MRSVHAHVASTSLETQGLSRNPTLFSWVLHCLCYYRLFNVLKPYACPADFVGPGPECFTLGGKWGKGPWWMASPCDGGCRGPWPKSSSYRLRFSGAIPRWQSIAYSPSRCDFRFHICQPCCLPDGVVASAMCCKRMKGVCKQEVREVLRGCVWTQRVSVIPAGQWGLLGAASLFIAKRTKLAATQHRKSRQVHSEAFSFIMRERKKTTGSFLPQLGAVASNV